MFATREFLLHARVDAETLEAWIEAGWLLPRRNGGAGRFSGVDLARARLIRDLKEDMGVNDDGIAVVLDLVDQVHGLRRALRELLLANYAHPEAEPRRLVAEGRGATGSYQTDQKPSQEPPTSSEGGRSG